MNALEVSHLRYAYADGKSALDDVSFSVGEGERLGLIGPNGAGKSTLLLHLNGLLPERISDKDAPSIRIFGDPIRRSGLPAIRAAVGLLFQDPDDQLFCPTVFDDVAFGPQQLNLEPAEITRRVRGALKEVGLEGFEQRQPHHLSRGEKRRVCLAGILACRPKMLALDEPTTDLDPRGRRELKALLKKLPVTQVIASHDLDLVAELCSRVVVLDQGRVVAAGPAIALLSDEALMLEHGLERPYVLQLSGVSKEIPTTEVSSNNTA